MMQQYYVYILTNKNNTVLYTGMTNNLLRRVYEHRHGIIAGFTKRYSIHKLVYFEIFQDAYQAIVREKQIKAGSRAKKLALIMSSNSKWDDLSEAFTQ